jgi:hypothetical protein
MHISLSFTKKEFDELLVLAGIGEYIRDSVLNDRGEYKGHDSESLMHKLYAEAKKHKIPGIVTKDLGGMMYTGPDNEREEQEHTWIEESEESNFWYELTTRLSRRDFFNEMTPADVAEMEKTDWLPERFQTYVEKYDTEFESYGIERLRIDTNTAVPSVLLVED